MQGDIVIMKRTYLYFVLALTMITGCAKTSPLPSDGQNLTNVPRPTFTTSATTPVPTEVSIITTPPTVMKPSIDKCLTIESDGSAGLVSTGTLILSDVDNRAYTLKLEGNEKLEISSKDEAVFDLAVSPDGKWMAYYQYPVNSNDNKKLVIVDFAGKRQLAIPWEKDWGFISSWLTPQNLLIGMDLSSSGETSAIKRGSTFLVLNPFTGGRQILSPEFLDIYDSSLLGIWSGSGLGATAYNSLLNKVVYLQGDSGIYQYVLWDIEQQHKLANFEVVIEGNAIPRWSPDGSQFAFAPSFNIENLNQRWPAYELYIVNGQITQLTTLTDYFPWVYIDDYSWSPDGKYIAFWFSWWSEPLSGYGLIAERHLAIVDIENKVVTNYCIQGKLGDDGRAPQPIWSPDGKQLVVESPSSEGHSQVVLIDLNRQIAVKLSEDMKPEGWMVAP